MKMCIPRLFTLTCPICISEYACTSEAGTRAASHPYVYQHLPTSTVYSRLLWEKQQKSNLILYPRPWYSVSYIRESIISLKEMSEWKSKLWINDTHIVLRFEYSHVLPVTAVVYTFNVSGAKPIYHPKLLGTNMLFIFPHCRRVHWFFSPDSATSPV